jgi:hypothetical protein
MRNVLVNRATDRTASGKPHRPSPLGHSSSSSRSMSTSGTALKLPSWIEQKRTLSVPRPPSRKALVSPTPLAQWGMHVSSVEPGAIETPIWEKGHEADWSATASKRGLDLYGEAYQAFRKWESQSAAGPIPCDAVSRAIFHALTARRPRTLYVVGTDARVYGWPARLCPDRVTDWVTRRVMGLGSVGASPRG